MASDQTIPDSVRIPRVLDKLRTLWQAVPQLSLAEIVGDAVGDLGAIPDDAQFEAWLDGQPVFHPEGEGAPA
jgi:hypothetical protein